VIIIEVELALEDSLEALFEGCFCYENLKIQTSSLIKAISNYHSL